MQHSRERCSRSLNHLLTDSAQSRWRHQTAASITPSNERLHCTQAGAARQTCAKSGQIYPPPTHYLTHAGSLLFWALYLAVPPLCELIVYNLCCVSLCNSVGNLPRSWRWPRYRFWDSLKAVSTNLGFLPRVDYTSWTVVNITYKVFTAEGLWVKTLIKDSFFAW